MRAYLRFRRIPYRQINQGSREDRGFPEPKPRLLPTFFLADADGQVGAHTDSTPLIRRFESDFSGREAIPPRPVLSLVDALLEDYADEWLTKAMFHYRWAFEADASKAAAVIPLWGNTAMPQAMHDGFARMFRERQVGRLPLVGSTPESAPVIENSYRRFLRAFDTHLREHAFLMGERPGASDFAVYGQLSQLALFDPTSVAITVEQSPRVYAWVERVEDLSGIEVGDDDWLETQPLPATLRAVLTEAGRVYVPFLLANAQALTEGAEQLEVTLDGIRFVQPPFRYQGKCLRWLREAFAALSSDERAAAKTALFDTGCEALFES